MPSLPASHPTAILYIDETGRLGNDGPFGVGCLKVKADSELLENVRAIRHANHVHAELQWKHVGGEATSQAYVDVLESVLKLAGSADQARFAAVFTDGSEQNLVKRFGDKWRAYEEMARQAVRAVLEEGQDEIVSILADRYTPPREFDFARTLRREINEERGCLTAATVVRLKSSAAEGLQIVDVVLGAIGYDFRKPGVQTGDKGRLAQTIRDAHGINSYRPRGRVQPGWFSVAYIGAPRTRGGRRAAAR